MFSSQSRSATRGDALNRRSSEAFLAARAKSFAKVRSTKVLASAIGTTPMASATRTSPGGTMASDAA
jgi:hypothetical protein